MRVDRNFRMSVRAQIFGAFQTNGAIAKGSPFGRTGDDADVQRFRCVQRLLCLKRPNRRDAPPERCTFWAESVVTADHARTLKSNVHAAAVANSPRCACGASALASAEMPGLWPTIMRCSMRGPVAWITFIIVSGAA